VNVSSDPIARFQAWLEEARAHEAIPEPTAFTLATTDAAGHPDARMVLLKDVCPAGFVFYTHQTSPKGRQLAEVPFAALCFGWPPLERQVRVRGPVEPVSAREADAYFASRPRTSRLGAWASRQSEPMPTPASLHHRLAAVTARFPLGPIPRPPHWSGYRVSPERIEFWRARPYRLHERIVYERDGEAWRTTRLFP